MEFFTTPNSKNIIATLRIVTIEKSESTFLLILYFHGLVNEFELFKQAFYFYYFADFCDVNTIYRGAFITEVLIGKSKHHWDRFFITMCNLNKTIENVICRIQVKIFGSTQNEGSLDRLILHSPYNILHFISSYTRLKDTLKTFECNV